jgi:hypothetical protein
MLILDTTDTAISASYSETHIEIDSWGRLKMILNDTGDDYIFPLVNLPFICS